MPALPRLLGAMFMALERLARRAYRKSRARLAAARALSAAAEPAVT
jgi:hypothetical protein